MKADKKDPEKDRRIGRILMFIPPVVFYLQMILYRTFITFL